MRGNAVMRAKRVTGPSAQSILCTHVACERCTRCKSQPVFVTRNPTALDKERLCEKCLAS